MFLVVDCVASFEHEKDYTKRPYTREASYVTQYSQYVCQMNSIAVSCRKDNRHLLEE